jgi:hypothetical protein
VSKHSRNPDKKNSIKIVDKEAERPPIRKTEESVILEQGEIENASNFNYAPAEDHNKPINLGDQVFKVVAVNTRFISGTLS